MGQFNHTVNIAIAGKVFACAALTLVLAIFYGIVATRIVAGYHEVRHCGNLQPKLNKIEKIKHWSQYRKAGEGRYAILFSSTTTDGAMAIFCALQMMFAVIKYHWFGIYQTAMNIDGSAAADMNGFILAAIAIMTGTACYAYIMYNVIQFTAFARAISLSEKVRSTGEYPHYAQRRSLAFFIECLKADEIRTQAVKAPRPAGERRKRTYTVAGMLNDSAEARKARHDASMKGYYRTNPPKADASKHRNITMSSRAS